MIPDNIDLVITQHPALLAYLREIGLATADTAVITHVTDPSVLDGKVTAGVLPFHLAARTLRHWEVPLAITAAERASKAELTLERVREIAVRYHNRRPGTRRAE